MSALINLKLIPLSFFLSCCRVVGGKSKNISIVVGNNELTNIKVFPQAIALQVC